MIYISQNIDDKLVPYFQVFQKSNGYAFEVIYRFDSVIDLRLVKLQSSDRKSICVQRIYYPCFYLNSGYFRSSIDMSDRVICNISLKGLLESYEPFAFNMKSPLIFADKRCSLVTVKSAFNVIKILPYLFFNRYKWLTETHSKAQDIIINHMIWMEKIKKHSEAFINSGNFIEF